VDGLFFFQDRLLAGDEKQNSEKQNSKVEKTPTRFNFYQFLFLTEFN
jgi:hypothetical protein